MQTYKYFVFDHSSFGKLTRVCILTNAKTMFKKSFINEVSTFRDRGDSKSTFNKSNFLNSKFLRAGSWVKSLILIVEGDIPLWVKDKVEAHRQTKEKRKKEEREREEEETKKE